MYKWNTLVLDWNHSCSLTRPQRAEFKYIYIYIHTYSNFTNLLAITERKYFLLKTPSPTTESSYFGFRDTGRRAGGCYGLRSTSRTRNIRGITCTTIISVSWKVFFVEPATRRQLKLDLSALHHQPVDDALSYSVRNNGPWYTSNCAWMGNCEAERVYTYAAALTHSWRNSAFVYRTKLRAWYSFFRGPFLVRMKNNFLACENNSRRKELASLALQSCFANYAIIWLFLFELLLRRALTVTGYYFHFKSKTESY